VAEVRAKIKPPNPNPPSPGRIPLRQQIAALKADKSLSEAQKKEDLAQLEAALKDAKPIQFKENIALIVKYFDKLPLKQEEGPADLAFR
jgi:hypothetical protein